MASAIRGVRVFPQKLANPARRGPQPQRVGQIAVGCHAPGWNLREEPGKLAFEINLRNVELHGCCAF
jgi:hypothetical protein